MKDPVKVGLALVVGLCALALAACGSSSSSGSASSSSSGSGAVASTLVVNQAGVPSTLDPDWGGAIAEDPIRAALYATLLTYKSTPASTPGTYEAKLDIKDLRPYVASSYAFSDDDKVLTLQIRPGMKFPSGRPVDAHAVAWTLNGLIAEQGGMWSTIEEEQHEPPLIKSVTATGPLTVAIKYSRPAPTQPLALTAIPVYDPTLVEAHGGMHKGKQNKWIASHDAGYGPYTIQSYSPGRQLVLEGDPDFFEPVKTKKLIFNFIPDNETLLLDARSGAADVTMGMSLQAAHSLANDSCCTVAAFNGANTEEMNFPEFPQAPAEFRSQTFRQALTYAVPYEGILKNVAYGWGKLFFGEWEPSFPWYDPAIGKPREYNLAKAKELLKKSGVKTPITFPFYIEEGNIISKEIATVVQGAWQELGVHAKIEVLPVSQFNEAAYEKHGGVTLLYDSTVEVAPAYLWSWDLQCKSAYNASGVCIPAADKRMKEIADGVFIDNPSKEQEVLDEVDQMYINNALRSWVYSPQTVVVMKKGVSGVGVFNFNVRLVEAFKR